MLAMRWFREMSVLNRLHDRVPKSVSSTKNLREPSENYHQTKGHRCKSLYRTERRRRNRSSRARIDARGSPITFWPELLACSRNAGQCNTGVDAHATSSIAATAGPSCTRGRHVYPRKRPSAACFNRTGGHLMCTVSDTSWTGRKDDTAVDAGLRFGNCVFSTPSGLCQPAIDTRRKRLPQLEQTSSLRPSAERRTFCGFVRRARVGGASSGPERRNASQMETGVDRGARQPPLA